MSISGSNLQELYTHKQSIQEEIDYLIKCKAEASDIDYWNSADRYAEEICTLQLDLGNINREIDNYVSQ